MHGVRKRNTSILADEGRACEEFISRTWEHELAELQILWRQPPEDETRVPSVWKSLLNMHICGRGNHFAAVCHFAAAGKQKTDRSKHTSSKQWRGRSVGKTKASPGEQLRRRCLSVHTSQPDEQISQVADADQWEACTVSAGHRSECQPTSQRDGW